MIKKDDALKLAKELDGVIADVEEGDGFDDVCLGTIKYVREALADHIRDATKMIEQPDYRAVKTWHEGKPVYVAEPPCKTGSQCTSKCQQCEQPAHYFDEVLYEGTSTREALVRFQTNVRPRGEATLAPVAEPHKQEIERLKSQNDELITTLREAQKCLRFGQDIATADELISKVVSKATGEQK